MGFENVYTKKARNNCPLTEKSTVLPFFGFSYKKNTDVRHKLVGGETRLTPNSSGGYDVSKAPTFWDSDTYYDVSFSRFYEPTGRKKELEDRFCELLKKRGKGVLSTGYLYTSITEFYADCYNKSRGAGCLSFILAILFYLAAVVFMTLGSEQAAAELPPRIHEFFVAFRENAVLVLGACGIFMVLMFVWWLIVHLHVKKRKALYPTFYSLPKKLQEKVRKAYFSSFRRDYYGEQAKILEEYAVLSGYDQR